jgi:antitoxin component YwqK of YwqJK toxin-antitoxin module|tara:strand:+ start:3864 stop:4748 length:885 start_codon:yes stop_codon:yes gene_type:complete
MKYLLLTLLLILTGCDEEPPAEIPSHLLVKNGGMTFEQGSKKPFTGVSVKYHENGEPEEKVTFEAGKETRKTVFIYDYNGQFKTKVNFIDGKKHGLWENYWSNGQLKSKENYKVGEKHGLWERYHENGLLDRKINYLDGKEDGLWESYRENGKLYLKRNFIDGKADGLWEEYYENGQLLQKGNYIDGKANGVWESYWANGQLNRKGNYIDEERDGLWEWFYDNGQLNGKGNYIAGDREGVWETYGRPMVKIRSYKDGMLHGLYQNFHPQDGYSALDYPKCYQNGKEVNLSICKQ